MKKHSSMCSNYIGKINKHQKMKKDFSEFQAWLPLGFGYNQTIESISVGSACAFWPSAASAPAALLPLSTSIVLHPPA